MEHFFNIKDLLYVAGFSITLLGFWWRLSARIADNATWKAQVSARLDAVEKDLKERSERSDRNFERIFSKLDEIGDHLHAIDVKLANIDTRLEAVETKLEN